ncbi:Peptidase C39 family protein [Planctomycetes bacterium Pan216]|uniref:Peptidase C39 family protein n=1 Tax=Kolteria novifilia TaxID=2527975 RepID=A0A518AY43_9BACT|nr:Peptidase C39 family protein [Planctomycetes bacterium Pan216]
MTTGKDTPENQPVDTVDRRETYPYVEQETRYMCGAASLRMVYLSLGLNVAQQHIWWEVSRNEVSARTHLLAHDAIQRGFEAMVIQLPDKDPWPALEEAHRVGASVILNHRPEKNSPSGHFSVLLGLDQDTIELHDPQGRPRRHETREEFANLWRRLPGVSSVPGFSLVVVTRPAREERRCELCDQVIPDVVACASCGFEMPLRPKSMLGCIGRTCEGRRWKKLFCPRCDAPRRHVTPFNYGMMTATEGETHG